MDRKDEYNQLMEELEFTPLKLDYTVSRAKAKKAAVDKRRRVAKAFFIPLGTLAAIFLVFTALVNFSPSFASACSEIPILNRLVEAVSMSPSLSKAVENDFVQEIGLEQTKDGVTARVEYVIVDQKQLNIFYTLKSDQYENIDADVDIVPNEGFFLSYGGPVQNEGDRLREVVVEFNDGKNMPSSLSLKLSVYDSSSYYDTSEPTQDSKSENLLSENKAEIPDYFTEFSFDLTFDPSFTSAGKAIAVKETFEIDGQTLTLDSLEVYPTHTRFHFSADENNSAWLKDLDFYFENEKGERFDGISNGVSASGEVDSPMMSTFMLESPYFYDAKKLTLHITGAVWLEKGKERMHINLADGTADNLPEGVKLALCKKYENGWKLYFSGTKQKISPEVYEITGWEYFDKDGNRYEIHGSSTFSGANPGYLDTDTGKMLSGDNEFVEEIKLIGYNYDEAWISVLFTSRTDSTQTIELDLK